MSPAAYRRELDWLTKQPWSVLVAYLKALKRLDLDDADRQALQLAVLTRLGRLA